MQTGQWNGHVFEVSASVIRGFADLAIKASSETDEKESDGEKYVEKKSSEPAEISFTVFLSAFTACSVQAEALAFLDDVNAGAQDHFYAGAQKLLPCKMLLTEASVDKIIISPGGVWTGCEVKLTLKQATRKDGATGTSESGGSSGDDGDSTSNTKKSTTKTTVYGSGSNGKENVSTLLARAAATIASAKSGSATVTQPSLYSKLSSHQVNAE